MDPVSVARQADAIYNSPSRSERTRRTYITTWKRLAGIAYQWTLARAESREESFWESIERFKDQRVRRRSTRQTSSKAPQRPWVASIDMSQDAGPGEREWVEGPQEARRRRLVVQLSDGTPVTLDLPDPLSDKDARLLAQAILRAAE